jgi:hypothetical protein
MLCLLHEKRLLKGAKCEGMTLLRTLQGRQEMKDGVGRATEVRHTTACMCGTVQPPHTAVYDYGHCTRAFTEPEVNHSSGSLQVEDDLPLDFAKKCLDEPSLLLTSDSQHIQQIKK